MNVPFVLAKSKLGDKFAGLVFEKLTPFLPVKKLVDTDMVVAFWHPKPFWEKHIVIVPKKAITELTALEDNDGKLISECIKVARDLVIRLGWKKEGYTLSLNGGPRQKVRQLHFHLGFGKVLLNK